VLQHFVEALVAWGILFCGSGSFTNTKLGGETSTGGSPPHLR
jgi:hypothetical protein